MALLGNGPEWTALSSMLNLVIQNVQMSSVKRLDASLASQRDVRNAESLFVTAPLDATRTSRDIREFIVRLRTQIRWGGILVFLGSTSDIEQLRGCDLIATDLHSSNPAHALITKPFALGAFVDLFFTLRAWQPGALDRFINTFDAAPKFRELRALSRRLSSKGNNEESVDLLELVVTGIWACKPLRELLKPPGHGLEEYEVLSRFVQTLKQRKEKHISAGALNVPAVKLVLHKYFARLNRTVFATT